MTIRWSPMAWGGPIVLPVIGGSRGRERERDHERAEVRVEHLEVLSEQENWVSYLTVCGGTGTWGYAHPTRRTAAGKPEMVNFTAGVHRVDAVTVQKVRDSGIPGLVLTDEMPIAVRRLADWYLRPEHIRVLPPGTELEAGTPVFESDLALERPLAHQCPHCGARFPHAAPLRRHVQRNHAATELQDESSLAEAEPPPEPALTDA